MKNKHPIFAQFQNDQTMMHFDDRDPYSFEQAVKNLCKGKSTAEAQENFLQSLQNYISGKFNNEDIQRLSDFHKWALDIHNSHLKAPEGSSWPNNIFYKMLQELRTLDKQNQLDPDEVFLLFMMEGINGRKINKGETPGTEFIATALANQVIKALETLEIENEKTISFKEKYAQSEDLVKQYRSFKDKFEEYKRDSNSLISILASKDALELKHELNKETGANAYSPKCNVRNMELLNSLTKNEIYTQANKLVNFLNEQADNFEKVMPSIKTGEISNPEQLVLWDLSEFVAKVILTLESSSVHESSDQESFLEKLKDTLNKPFVKEISARNAKGNYPIAKTREVDLTHLDQITTIFQQEEIHNYPDTTLVGSDSVTSADLS